VSLTNAVLAGTFVVLCNDITVAVTKHDDAGNEAEQSPVYTFPQEAINALQLTSSTTSKFLYVNGKFDSCMWNLHYHVPLFNMYRDRLVFSMLVKPYNNSNELQRIYYTSGLECFVNSAKDVLVCHATIWWHTLWCSNSVVPASAVVNTAALATFMEQPITKEQVQQNQRYFKTMLQSQLFVVKQNNSNSDTVIIVTID